MKNKLSIGRVLNGVLLVILTFVCIYPFLNVIAYSLSGYNAVLTGNVTVLPKDFCLDASTFAPLGCSSSSTCLLVGCRMS